MTLELIALHTRHAAEVAALWLAGVRENALSDPAYWPAFSEDRYAELMASRLASGSVFGWAAIEPSTGRLAAYLTAELKRSAPEFRKREHLGLLDLDVQRAHRRKGLGTSLVAAARLHARAAGLSSIEVNWVTTDAQASAFWHRQGFGPHLSRGRLGLSGIDE